MSTKEKFKEWAAAVRHCAGWASNEGSEESARIAYEAADSLQSLADTAEDEPYDCIYHQQRYSSDGSPNAEKTPFVTKANRDYWQRLFWNKCDSLHGAERELTAVKEAFADELQCHLETKRELAAKDARIAELEGLYSEPRGPFKNTPFECSHASAILMCNDCGINFRNATLNQPKRSLLAEEPGVFFSRLMDVIDTTVLYSKTGCGKNAFDRARIALHSLLVGDAP